LVAAAAQAAAGAPGEISSVIDAEVSRLRTLVETTEIDRRSWAQITTLAMIRLGDVESEVAAGRSLYALHLLSGVRNTVLAYLHTAEMSTETFDAEWERVRGNLVASPPPLATGTAAAVRGMAEAARGRMRPYHSASGSIVAATTAANGMFSLGRAHASADWVRFCDGLEQDDLPPAPALRSIDSELARLEDEILEAYVPPRSIEDHPGFIRLHAKLKLSRELNEVGAYAGALYKYLETRLLFAEMMAEPAAGEAEIQRELDAFALRFEDGGRDDSIGRLFLEMAMSADGGLRARAVLDHVLPAYLAALAPDSAAPASADAVVTVTLVRWPFKCEFSDPAALLAKEVVRGFEGQVAFVSENFGQSELAESFGVRRYPAIFVDDVLVAKPKDFGFPGRGGSQGAGRYLPWKAVASHEKFKQDLARNIHLALADRTDAEIAGLPSFTLTDLDGVELSAADLAGRVVVVEFWASWCPPCRTTLGWLGELRKTHGDDVAVIAVAVESPEADVRALRGAPADGVRWAIGTPELTAAFGDLVAVPAMFVFDRRGRTVTVFYGASPDLRAQAVALVDLLADGS